jgi:hypothetical protein
MYAIDKAGTFCYATEYSFCQAFDNWVEVRGSIPTNGGAPPGHDAITWPAMLLRHASDEGRADPMSGRQNK